MDPKRLARLLVDSGRVSAEDLRALEREQAAEAARGASPTPLPDLVVRRGLMSDAELRALVEREAAYGETQRRPSRLLGRFEIRGELGRGGMGIVYRAWQADLDREVALKVLPSDADAELKARFLREARVACRLRHPNILPVHELGEHEGRPFFAMDLVDGAPFDDWRRGRPLGEAVGKLVLVARALGHAHRQGVIHRDLKPQNILVAKDGTPYLADFGLAREVSGAGALTLSGQILGTPAFMSPEQARGGKTPVDARSDLYSFGVVLYQLVADDLPFRADSVYDLLDAIIRKAPKRPGGPPALEAVVLRCLEKDPARRFATADEVADVLERALAASAAAPRRRLSPAWIAVPVLIAALAAFFALRPRPEAPAPASAVAFDPTGWEVLPANRRGAASWTAAREAAGIRLRNAQVRHLSVFHGDRRLSAVVRPTRPGGVIVLSLAGYRLERRDEALVLLGPDRRELYRGEAAAPSMGLDVGPTRLIVRSGGAEVHREPVRNALAAVRPWYAALEDAEAVFSEVEVVGDTPTAASDVERQLAELGRSLALGPEQDLLAGGDSGRFRLFEKGRVERDGPDLRVISEPGRRVELHGPHARTSRLRLRYRADAAQGLVLRVRAGTREVNFHLPLDEPGRWRDVEVVALEGATAATVDGLYRLASAEDDGSTSMDGLLRLSVRDGAVAIRRATLETISGLPEEPVWTAVMPADVPSGWSVKDGQLAGTGALPIPQAAPEFDLEVLAISAQGARLEMARNGRRIFLTAPYPHAGETVGFSLQVRARRADWLETCLFDEVERGALAMPLEKGPLELRVHGGPVRILAIRTRAR